jgi:glycerol-3-phosphate cytidylyltransferase
MDSWVINRVWVGGTFDLFHAGHVDLLRQCSEQGHVYVSLNTDNFVERYKGQRPIMTFNERKAVLEACKYVYKVIENKGGEDSKPSINEVEPNFIAVGSDWLQKDYLKQLGITVDYLEEKNIKLLYIPRPVYVDRISSTNIKQRVLDAQRGY